jgi:hypothetical protein
MARYRAHFLDCGDDIIATHQAEYADDETAIETALASTYCHT